MLNWAWKKFYNLGASALIKSAKKVIRALNVGQGHSAFSKSLQRTISMQGLTFATITPADNSLKIFKSQSLEPKM